MSCAQTPFTVRMPIRMDAIGDAKIYAFMYKHK